MPPVPKSRQTDLFVVLHDTESGKHPSAGRRKDLIVRQAHVLLYQGGSEVRGAATKLRGSHYQLMIEVNISL